MFSQRFSKPTNSASLDFVSLDIVLLVFMCMHIKSSSTMSRQCYWGLELGFKGYWVLEIQGCPGLGGIRALGFRV